MVQSGVYIGATIGDVFAWTTSFLSLLLVLGVAAIAAAGVRPKHHASALNQQLCLLALMIVSTFLVGWWVRQLFVGGPGITGGAGSGLSDAFPWSDRMGPGLGADGAVSPTPGWLRHATACWLVAALVGLAAAERLRTSALLLLAMLAGSLCSSIAAAWMWSAESWLVRLVGFHDAFGAASVHAVAGGFALGVLQVLGPRTAATAGPGVVRLACAKPWLSTLGLLFLIGGLAAFAAATLAPLAASGSAALVMAGVYGTPAPLFGVAGNLSLAVASGILVGHILGDGEPARTLAGGVAGLVAVFAGADLYHPLQSFLLAAVVSWLSLRFGDRVRDRHGIDDAAGIVSIHGFAAAAGLLAAGFLLWTVPSSGTPGAAAVNPFGNTVGAAFGFILFGQLPGYAAARFLNYLGILRIRSSIELAGGDLMMEVRAADLSERSLDRERAFIRERTPQAEVGVVLQTNRRSVL
ncbi:hypothetical protein C0214_26905 (plasmid) [Methylobacterium sp. DM1]|nr:hypothetical protein C0214_26905 [Methylobacterium sp. DM1]